MIYQLQSGVPNEVIKLLKEGGYEFKLEGDYKLKSGKTIYFQGIIPTFASVIDWLRKDKKYFVGIFPDECKHGKWNMYHYYTYCSTENVQVFDNYGKALIEGITQAIKHINQNNLS
jgi:hypothetical protein